MDALPQPPPMSGILDVGNPEDYAGFGEPRHVTLSSFYATPTEADVMDTLMIPADTSGWKKHRKEVARRKTRERMAELERIRKQHAERSMAR